MSFEEENSGPNLKELLTQNLEMNGTLGNIQAQLRASIFLTLEEEFKEKNIPIVNEKTRKVLQSPVGKTAIAIIQDFLSCLNLEFSLSVFNPEVNAPPSQHKDDRTILDKLFNKNISLKDETCPVLFKLIESIQQSNKVNGNENFSTNEQNNNADSTTIQEKKEIVNESLPDIQSTTVRKPIEDLDNNQPSKTEVSTNENSGKENTAWIIPLLSKKKEDEPNFSDRDEDDYEDEDFSSGTEHREAPEDKKNPEKPEDTDDADEISEDLPDSYGGLLDSISEKSDHTIDVTASESNQVADYEESL